MYIWRSLSPCTASVTLFVSLCAKDFSDKSLFSVCHGDMDDFSAARMILSGIPLDESFLQHWLSILMKEKQRSLGGEKLPVPESYYSLGTADPTGILESDEVCVILYAKSVAADSWLALMDWLLILGEDCIEEKDHVKANILQLIDIYYDALDAPKKGP